MFNAKNAFSSFSVDDIQAARRFYGDKLGLEVRDSREEGILEVQAGGGAPVLIYPKPDHKPAVFTILNFPVKDIDAAVGDLNKVGVQMAEFDVGGGTGDAKGIHRGEGGPPIAWFRDPAGNILSVLEASGPS